VPPAGIGQHAQGIRASAMSLVDKVAALRQMFGLTAGAVPLALEVRSMNLLMGLSSDGSLPAQVDRLVAETGVLVQTLAVQRAPSPAEPSQRDPPTAAPAPAPSQRPSSHAAPPQRVPPAAAHAAPPHRVPAAAAPAPSLPAVPSKTSGGKRKVQGKPESAHEDKSQRTLFQVLPSAPRMFMPKSALRAMEQDGPVSQDVLMQQMGLR
jgi:hypothetical protein